MPEPVTIKTPLQRLGKELNTRIKDVAWFLQEEQDATQAIGAKGAELGWPAPISGLTGSTDGKGYVEAYPNGAWILWRKDRGAHAVYGAIAAKWRELGGESGFLGWPQTDETGTPNGAARFNHFDGGSVYWSGTTGAHAIYGAIRDLWASMGWERSALGLPTSDEMDVPGTPGARRNTFESGEVTWTPWAGANVTRLYNVNPDTPPAGVRIQNVGNGAPTPGPQVKRHIVISAVMDITDDETFGSNEHNHVERRDERWLDSYDPQGVMTMIGKAGGEVRVELTANAAPRVDGSMRIFVDLKLYEGTSEESNDLDGTKTQEIIVPADQVLQIPLRINNDDEGGDFADISLVLSNFATSGPPTSDGAPPDPSDPGGAVHVRLVLRL
jgi:hypothetical protein